MKIQSFDFSVDLLQAILWEYNDSARIESLINSKQAWYARNQSNFWETWRRDVFDLRTANEFGLSVWAILLNIPLSIAQVTTSKISFGFGPYRKNFDNGNFTSLNSESGLTAEESRTLLRIRYFQLCTNASIPNINKFMAYLFGPLQVWALDGFNMTMSYVFNFNISNNLLSALKKFDVLPRPATVKITNYFITGKVGFGFGPYRKNFDNGNFNG